MNLRPSLLLSASFILSFSLSCSSLQASGLVKEDTEKTFTPTQVIQFFTVPNQEQTEMATNQAQREPVTGKRARDKGKEKAHEESSTPTSASPSTSRAPSPESMKKQRLAEPTSSSDDVDPSLDKKVAQLPLQQKAFLTMLKSLNENSSKDDLRILATAGHKIASIYKEIGSARWESVVDTDRNFAEAIKALKKAGQYYSKAIELSGTEATVHSYYGAGDCFTWVANLLPKESQEKGQYYLKTLPFYLELFPKLGSLMTELVDIPVLVYRLAGDISIPFEHNYEREILNPLRKYGYSQEAEQLKKAWEEFERVKDGIFARREYEENPGVLI